jgi:hypothetical protein
MLGLNRQDVTYRVIFLEVSGYWQSQHSMRTRNSRWYGNNVPSMRPNKTEDL